MSGDLDFASAIEAAAAIRTGRVSSLELTERAFKRIDRFDPALRAFGYLLREKALVQAASADANRAAGAVLGPLMVCPSTSRKRSRSPSSRAPGGWTP